MNRISFAGWLRASNNEVGRTMEATKTSLRARLHNEKDSRKAQWCCVNFFMSERMPQKSTRRFVLLFQEISAAQRLSSLKGFPGSKPLHLYKYNDIYRDAALIESMAVFKCLRMAYIFGCHPGSPSRLLCRCSICLAVSQTTIKTLAAFFVEVLKHSVTYILLAVFNRIF